ncbi:Aste57867_23740 [Aphanomyces stellatus]|uniref:Aste57867_23740 protein n=1 Tax=Aphanomyces stellatus TaxID=120398 RepID=A0A485LNG0_9STRA|nr:hypothetical protein As57867_023668 [Aphanomyces stellatus]VFU00385.1 Aste57867_23740 [Aphanomyces stellatus]
MVGTTRKIHVSRSVSALERHVVWHKPMAVLSVVIALNIASMPLKAYWSESFPWQFTRVSHDTAFLDFDTYSRNTSASFQAFFSPNFLAGQGILVHDRANGTFAMQRTIDLSTPLSCANLIPRLPGAFFFGVGLRDAVCVFLGQNNSARDATPLSRCQHVRIMSIPFGEQCLWAFRSTVSSSSSCWTFVQGIVNWHNHAALWAKLVYRIGLTGYVCREMYTQYYVHYRVLAANFIDLGLRDRTLMTLEIYVGDPTSVILSNMCVSLAFVLDFWFSADAVGESIVQISQLESVPDFVAALLYSSRTAWFGYFTMRVATMPIKRWHYEAYVSPLDPTVVAIAIFCFAGPFMYLQTTTSFMAVVHSMWELWIPAAEAGEAIDVMPVIASETIGIGVPPLLFSFVYKWFKQHQFKSRGPARNLLASTMYNQVEYNDIRQRVAFHVLGLKRTFTSTSFEGGTLYNLHDRNARYDSMPLFSHRSADCFVACYTSLRELKAKMRLSLVRCLDRLEYDNVLAVQLCRTKHKDCLSRLDATACETFVPSSPASLCLHQGKQRSPWIL